MNMKRTCLGAFIGMITALMTTSCITGQSGYEEVGDNEAIIQAIKRVRREGDGMNCREIIRWVCA